ncbi:hypothetical protein CAP48_09115 [Advenella sp. S44]|nr:hypothetical protein CAP48_09115 [Advenella sp. S44]
MASICENRLSEPDTAVRVDYADLQYFVATIKNQSAVRIRVNFPLHRIALKVWYAASKESQVIEKTFRNNHQHELLRAPIEHAMEFYKRHCDLYSGHMNQNDNKRPAFASL